MPESGLFEWLEATWLASSIRESPLLFPFIEIFHILGFVVLVGSAFLFDLRLLGVSSSVPVTSLAGHLLPWARRSLVLVVPTGLLLFLVQAVALSTSTIFHFKLILILLAIGNAATFHLSTYRTVESWNVYAPTPVRAKAAAIVSFILWLSVIGCGRLIAYF